LPKTSPSKKTAAQVAVEKAANVKAESHTSAIAPDLIEANEQGLADQALAPANPPACRNDERNAHAARAPPARLGVRLLSKREVLAIANVSYPTLWAWMRQGMFPRSRVAGGKSVWRSDEVDAWLATLPVRHLKGDPGYTSPPGAVSVRRTKKTGKGSRKRKTAAQSSASAESGAAQ
jgi:predicted DNA-binding transcriptional regulator AlpA